MSSRHSPTPALADIRVVDFTRDHGNRSPSVAALICRLLGSAGAQVTRPVAISGACGLPHPNSTPDPGTHSMLALLSDADVVITTDDDIPGDDVSEATVVAHLDESTFLGLGLPAHAHELVAQAVSGAVHEHVSGRPAFNGSHLATHGAAINGATAIVSALLERLTSGRGQRLQISMTAGALSFMSVVWPSWEDHGVQHGFAPVGADFPVYRCADGQHICFTNGPGRLSTSHPAGRRRSGLELLAEAIDFPGDPALLGGTADENDLEHYYANAELVGQYVGCIPSAELLQRLRAADFAAELVAGPEVNFHQTGEALLRTCSCGNVYLDTQIEGL